MTRVLAASVLWALALETGVAQRSLDLTSGTPPPRTLGDAPRSTTVPNTTTVQPQARTSAIASAPVLSLDPAARRASRNFYNAIYSASNGIPDGWTGDVASGVAGSTSQNFKDVVALRINVFRAFAGVPAGITLNTTWNNADQQAALMMSANNSLSHHPPTTWTDYTATGAQAAGNSDIALGEYGPDAVNGYMEDPGSNNTVAGHRRWVLYPPTLQMGTGDIPHDGNFKAANALWVMDMGHAYPSTRDGFVAWPPKGSVPYQFVYPRWTFSLASADFSNAHVAVTRNGTNVPTTIISSTDNGYGDNTVVWTLSGAPDGTTYAAPASDTTYAVTVSNVMLSGTAHSYTYSVIVFDPAVAGPDDILPAFSSNTAVMGATTNFTFTAIPEASSYVVWSATLNTAAWIEGAESTPYHLTRETTGTYSCVNATTSASGAKCFQLCQDGFNNQDLLLNSSFVPTASSSLSFKSRFGYMSASQFARVQVSLDDGSSWINVFSRAGTSSDSGSFSTQSVSLAAYANRIIRVRFLLDYTGGSAYTQTGQNAVGWLIDDITPVNLAEASAITETPTNSNSYAYTAPNQASTENFAARGMLFDTYPLEYGPVTNVTVGPPLNPPTITSDASASGTVGVALNPFTVTATSTGSPTVFGATGLPGGLSIDATTGIISGTPIAAGTFNAALTATNSSTNASGTATLTMTIARGTATIMLGNLSVPFTGTPVTVTAQTTPGSLPVTITYNGSNKPPSAIGSYTVTATVDTANYTGTSTNTLTITAAAATVTLGNLNRTYTGKAQVVTATTLPAKLAVTFTYAGSAIAPTLVGNYAVVATVNNPNYTGSANGTLVIAPVLPLATTGVALVGPTSATLDATVGPKGSATSVVFEYGTTTTYDHTTASQNVAVGTATVPVSKAISGLSPQTLYHYHVVATNAAGTVNGMDKTFTTVAPPVFTGNGTAYLSATGAQLSQVINPSGVATQVYFEYGTTSGNYTAQSALQTIGAGKTNVTVYALLSGLNANTTYFYRLVTVTAGGGTIASPTESSFTTLGFDTALVAQKGDAATEVANATYNTFGNPIINSHDAIAFAATLTGSGATTTTNLAIFAETNLGVPHKIVRTGDTAPGAGGATFASVGDPVFNNNAAVAFGGQLKIVTGQATKTTALGVWSTSSGSLQLVARQGSVAPETSGALFTTFNAVGLSDADTVILGTLTTNAALGVTAATNFGVWEGTTSNNLALVLRTGDVVGNKTISSLSLFSTQAIVGGQTRNFASNSGNLVCGATFSDKTTGIVKVIGGNESLVAAKTDVAVGTSGATFATFGNPIINTSDRVAFAATLAPVAGLVTTANNVGIWAENGSGTRQLVARTGNIAPGTNPAASFASFSDPVYNNNQAVAFGGTLKVTVGQATKTTTLGIWCNSGGSLEKIIQQGDPAPGCPTGATFATFPAIALPDTGGVIFKATLNANATAAVTTTNNTGLWAIDNNGDLQLIVRTGDILGSKTITALTVLPASTSTDCQSRSFTQSSGDVVYLATFSDKSSAIYNVQFP